MNRDEILKIVQIAPQDMGEFECMISKRALFIGTAVGVGLCLVMMVIEILGFRKIDMGKPGIIFAISAFSNLYEGLKLGGKKRIIQGIINTILTIVCFGLFLGA